MNKMSFLSMICCLLAVACAHNPKDKVETADQHKVQKTNQEEPEKNSKDVKAISCLVQKDNRIISLDQEPKRCEVFYTKFGQRSQVAWAEATPSLCTDVMAKIRNNIESKGFKCTTQKEETKQENAILRKTAKTADRDTASEQ